MKQVLGIFSGFVVSLAMFVGGLAAATLIITAEPRQQARLSLDLANVWTAEPRRVDTVTQDFERISKPLVSKKIEPPATDAVASAIPVDRDAVPAVLQASIDPQSAQADQLSAAHVEWCASRYRSYRTETDRYTRYNGKQRPCISPYMRRMGVAEGSFQVSADAVSETVQPDDSLSAEYSDEMTAYPDANHVSYCFSRYRSYRPEDNTYQPYSGGRRRQCVSDGGI